MAGKASYIPETPCMKCFWEVIVHWIMIMWLFTYVMWPVNTKKTFPFHFRMPEKPPHASVKTFLRLYGSFCEIYTFQLGVFSIRNFYLRNLKGNGNAPSVNQERCVVLNLWYSSSCALFITRSPVIILAITLLLASSSSSSLSLDVKSRLFL